MMFDAPERWSVTIPMQDLNTLLSAVQELPKIRQELASCYDQLDACRSIQIELMEKYQELYKLL